MRRNRSAVLTGKNRIEVLALSISSSVFLGKTIGLIHYVQLTVVA